MTNDNTYALCSTLYAPSTTLHSFLYYENHNDNNCKKKGKKTYEHTDGVAKRSNKISTT
jgi:hypothetical protein